jgi:hypothetical protein
VEIYDTETGMLMDSTYAIGYGIDDNGKLVLKVDTEFIK